LLFQLSNTSLVGLELLASGIVLTRGGGEFGSLERNVSE
jgi:hypothetical protein